jgi:SecD/SecF fusion protein
VTTLIAALVLFQFGTGPVKGFATTLSIGIISSMFTSLFVTRVVFDALTTGKRKIQDLVMLKIINKPNINFIKMRKVAYAISAFLLIWGLITFASRGKDNYGIDFTGGTIQQFRFEQSVDTQEVRDVLKDIGIGDAVIQKFGNDKEFIIRSFELDPEKIIGQFKTTFSDNDFEVLRVEKVGPSVGADLQSKAIKALIFAMICMVIYISIRFEVRFAVAAIVALLHDIGISIGVLSLTGREISTPVIAALLTIVGYSINDTIVVFDRIREDRKLMRKASYEEVINASINQTLSRTILTSFTTFAVVLTLFLLGGAVINDFAFVLMVGVIVGTYSSIFIASPILIDWPGRRVVKR